MTIAFRPVLPGDRRRIEEIAAGIWEGHDFLPRVFDRWVSDPRSYFGAVLVDGVFAGCGRLMPFDARRAWLEGLRVDPGMQGRGLGREIALHLFGAGRERGFADLYFSTYFENRASIAIAEAVGFRPVLACTNLELELGAPAAEPRGSAGASLKPAAAGRASRASQTSRLREEVRVAPGMIGVPQDVFLWNDWLCVPADAPERERFFPGAATFSRGASGIVVSDGYRFPENLEIVWTGPGAADDIHACVEAAIGRARLQRCRRAHLMLPASADPEPFVSAGFRWIERTGDVFLYHAAVSGLRI